MSAKKFIKNTRNSIFPGVNVKIFFFTFIALAHHQQKYHFVNAAQASKGPKAISTNTLITRLIYLRKKQNEKKYYFPKENQNSRFHRNFLGFVFRVLRLLFLFWLLQICLWLIK